MNTSTLNQTTQHKPSFYIFREDGSRDSDIIQSFLIKRNITVEEVISGKLTLEGQAGKVWNIILDDHARVIFKKRNEAFCLVSFQSKKQGYFAVIRIYKNKAARLQQHNATHNNSGQSQ